MKMKYIPTISSTISPRYLASFLKEQYGLKDASCKVIRIGINHTYLVETDFEKYILRVYTHNWRSQKEVEGEMELLSWLKNKVSVSYPIRDKNGDYIQKMNAIEGERFMVLFSYAKGEIVRNPSEKICYTLGLEMAKMHQITLNKQLPRKDYNTDSLVGWVHDAVQSHFPTSTNELEYIQKAHQLLSDQFKNADYNALKSGIIHLDLWSQNFKIQNDSMITLFDFDNCGNGWFFLDIAYAVMLLFKEEPDKAIFEKKKASFYRGYESILAISEEEKRLVPYGGLAIWLHYTGIHAIRFDDFSSLFFSPAYLKAWLQIVNNWMIYNKIEV